MTSKIYLLYIMKYNFYSKKYILILFFIFLIYNTFISNIFLRNEKFSNSLFQNLDISPAPTEYNTKGLSPHILKITKEGKTITIYLKKNIRDIDILNPKEISVYEIYFKRKDELHLTCPEPSPTSKTPIIPNPSPSYDDTFLYEKRNINLNDWYNYVVYCNSDAICKIKLEHDYFNTDKEYIFFTIKNNNNKKSYIENLVTITNKKQFNIFKLNDKVKEVMTEKEKEILYNTEKKCDEYSFKECPTDITGTILARCYQDKTNKKCEPLIFDKTVFKD